LSTLVDADRNARKASMTGFDVATTQLIENFDAALADFETSVRAGKANVRVVRRGQVGSGGGAFGVPEVVALVLLLICTMRRLRPGVRAN
jgi:rhombotail lipoprotein